ncbi:O-seryl-isobutylhydroxylamine esterase [Micromonospora ureilytica]|uniref:O-seryl-isobutylhydroxylamine esterase n=2 Tax=Micromonospora ureilytica TaxID=709868 RepID=A0A3N9XX03_9ACTN|nr:O-seryl-isobutylhydroxylamine esterase [Micromonospora ureilytica]
MEPMSALAVLRRHAQHSSAALALNKDTRHFTVPGLDGFIAYRPAGRRHAVQLGSVYADPDDCKRLLGAFHGWAQQEGRRLCAIQLTPDDIDLYAEFGYRLSQLGAAYSIDLNGFRLSGRKFEKVRNKLARSRRAGVTVVEAGRDVPYDARLAAKLDAMDARWLADKGRHVKQIEFLVGERSRHDDRVRRLFLALSDGEPVAYVSYSPAFGREGGWLYDITRREPDAPPGAVDLAFVVALQRFQEESVRWLHLGLTPFRELSALHQPVSGSHRGTERLIRFIAEHGDWIYPARSQAEFKEKWQPRVTPEYVGFYPNVSLRTVWRLLRLTRAV